MKKHIDITFQPQSIECCGSVSAIYTSHLWVCSKAWPKTSTDQRPKIYKTLSSIKDIFYLYYWKVCSLSAFCWVDKIFYTWIYEGKGNYKCEVCVQRSLKLMVYKVLVAWTRMKINQKIKAKNWWRKKTSSFPLTQAG